MAGVIMPLIVAKGGREREVASSDHLRYPREDQRQKTGERTAALAAPGVNLASQVARFGRRQLCCEDASPLGFQERMRPS